MSTSFQPLFRYPQRAEKGCPVRGYHVLHNPCQQHGRDSKASWVSMRAAICAIIRWTMWNTIFLVAVVQAHNTNPYWRSGVQLPLQTAFPHRRVCAALVLRPLRYPQLEVLRA